MGRLIIQPWETDIFPKPPGLHCRSGDSERTYLRELLC